MVSLHQNVFENNLEAITKAIAEGLDLNETRDDLFSGKSPLGIAIDERNLEGMELLLKAGANVNQFIKKKIALTPALVSKIYSPLMYACAKPLIDERIVSQLLEHKADVNLPNRDKLTPLHLTAMNGHLQLCTTLLAKGANVNAIALEPNAATPLHCAVHHRHINVIKLLLTNGADINHKDTQGRTPLHHAIDKSDIKILQLLLANGADINRKDAQGRTPLLMAIALSISSIPPKKISKSEPVVIQEKIIRALFPYEPDITLVDSAGNDAFTLAMQSKALSNAIKAKILGNTLPNMMLYLESYLQKKEHLASLDSSETYNMLNALNENLMQDIECNINNYFSRISPSLTAKELCSAYQEQWQKEKRLGQAIDQDNVEAVKDLLSKGVDPNCRLYWENDKKRSPLQMAIDKENAAIVELLLREGADINQRVKEHKNCSLLTYAFFSFEPIMNSTQEKVVSTLLEFEPDVTLQDEEGCTPLHRAAFVGNNVFCEIILKLGATNINAKAALGTPLHYALHSLLKAAQLKNDATFRVLSQALGLILGQTADPTLDKILDKKVQTIRTLLYKNPNCKIKDKKGKTPFMLASQSNYLPHAVKGEIFSLSEPYIAALTLLFNSIKPLEERLPKLPKDLPNELYLEVMRDVIATYFLNDSSSKNQKAIVEYLAAYEEAKANEADQITVQSTNTPYFGP